MVAQSGVFICIADLVQVQVACQVGRSYRRVPSKGGGNHRLNGAQMGVDGIVDPRFAGAAMTNPPITCQGVNYT